MENTGYDYIITLSFKTMMDGWGFFVFKLDGNSIFLSFT